MTAKDNDEGRIQVYQDRNKFIIDSTNKEAVEFTIGRPPYCPFAKKNLNALIDWSLGKGLIQMASSVLVEETGPSPRILVTKRSNKLSTFPGLWVPPGGHIDSEESMTDAARRELAEEIGIAFERDPDRLPYFSRDLVPLCAWESAFPTFISKTKLTPPKRHHLILYFTTSFSDETKEDFPEYPLVPLKLAEDEVVAAAWLTPDHIKALVDDMEKCDSLLTSSKVIYREDITSYAIKMQKKEHFPDCHLFKERFTFPSKAICDSLDPVDYWCSVSRRWEQRAFSDTFLGLFSGNKIDPSLNLNRNPTRFSIGTIYAMKKWLLRLKLY